MEMRLGVKTDAYITVARRHQNGVARDNVKLVRLPDHLKYLLYFFFYYFIVEMNNILGAGVA